MANKTFAKAAVAVAVVAAAAVAGFALLRGRGQSSADDWRQPDDPRPVTEATRVASAPAAEKAPAASQADAGRVRRKAVAGKGRRTMPAKNQKRVRPVVAEVSIDDRDDLNADEKKIMKSIDRALDDDSLPELLKVVSAASVSANDEVRSEMVDALGWFGDKAMLELLPFMADKDPEIAQSARDHWTSALSDVPERRRAELVERTATALKDKEAIEEIIDQLDDCDEVVAIQTVINIIESGNKEAAEVAREEYEFLTGEEYTTFEAAEAWLKENYTPDDDADGDDAGDEADE